MKKSWVITILSVVVIFFSVGYIAMSLLLDPNQGVSPPRADKSEKEEKETLPRSKDPTNTESGIAESEPEEPVTDAPLPDSELSEEPIEEKEEKIEEPEPHRPPRVKRIAPREVEETQSKPPSRRDVPAPSTTDTPSTTAREPDVDSTPESESEVKPLKPEPTLEDYGIDLDAPPPDAFDFGE